MEIFSVRCLVYCIHHLLDFFTNQIGISKGAASKWSTNVYIFVGLSYKVASNLGILPIYSFFLLDKFGLNNRLLRVVFSVTVLCLLHNTFWPVNNLCLLTSAIHVILLSNFLGQWEKQKTSQFFLWPIFVIKQSLPIYDFLST